MRECYLGTLCDATGSRGVEIVQDFFMVGVVSGAEKRNRMSEVKRFLAGIGLMVVFLSLPHILFDGPVPLGSLPPAEPHEPGQIDVAHMMGSIKQAYLLLSANLIYILMLVLAAECFIVWRKPE